MNLARHLLLLAASLFVAGGAWAAPVVFTFESATSFDAQFGSSQTFTPELPFSGSGDIDEAGGTYDVTLPTFTIVIDVLAVPGDDAEIETTGWGQVGTFTPGAGEQDLNGTSASGTSTCTDLGGGLGGLVCAEVPPNILPWPPTGDAGPTLGPPGAFIDTADGPGYDGTIRVVEAFDSNGGQLENIYRYSFLSVPEPATTAMLLGAGFALLLARRRA